MDASTVTTSSGGSALDSPRSAYFDSAGSIGPGSVFLPGNSGLVLGSNRARPSWTPEEDLILLGHVAKYGSRNWSSLQASGQLPHRDQKACCNRFILLKRRCMKEGKCVFPSPSELSRPPSHAPPLSSTEDALGVNKQRLKVSSLKNKGHVPPLAIQALLEDAKARALSTRQHQQQHQQQHQHHQQHQQLSWSCSAPSSPDACFSPSPAGFLSAKSFSAPEVTSPFHATSAAMQPLEVPEFQPGNVAKWHSVLSSMQQQHQEHQEPEFFHTQERQQAPRHTLKLKPLHVLQQEEQQAYQVQQAEEKHWHNQRHCLKLKQQFADQSYIPSWFLPEQSYPSQSYQQEQQWMGPEQGSASQEDHTSLWVSVPGSNPYLGPATTADATVPKHVSVFRVLEAKARECLKGGLSAQLTPKAGEGCSLKRDVECVENAMLQQKQQTQQEQQEQKNQKKHQELEDGKGGSKGGLLQAAALGPGPGTRTPPAEDDDLFAFFGEDLVPLCLSN